MRHVLRKRLPRPACPSLRSSAGFWGSHATSTACPRSSSSRRRAAGVCRVLVRWKSPCDRARGAVPLLVSAQMKQRSCWGVCLVWGTRAWRRRESHGHKKKFRDKGQRSVGTPTSSTQEAGTAVTPPTPSAPRGELQGPMTSTNPMLLAQGMAQGAVPGCWALPAVRGRPRPCPWAGTFPWHPAAPEETELLTTSCPKQQLCAGGVAASCAPRCG